MSRFETHVDSWRAAIATIKGVPIAYRRRIRELRDGSVAVHPTEDVPVELFRHDGVEWNRAD